MHRLIEKPGSGKLSARLQFCPPDDHLLVLVNDSATKALSLVAPDAPIVVQGQGEANPPSPNK